MPEVSNDARFLFLLAHSVGESGKCLLHEGNVFCREGAEDEERISRVVRRPGSAGAGPLEEELLEAVLELIKVISKD